MSLTATSGDPRPNGAAQAGALVGAVAQASGRDREEASRTAAVVLGELAATLSWGKAQGIADYLPNRFGQVMTRRSFESSMARFSPATFIARIAEQEGVDTVTATAHVTVLLRIVEQWVPAVLMAGVREELPGLWKVLRLDGPPRPRGPAEWMPAEAAARQREWT